MNWNHPSIVLAMAGLRDATENTHAACNRVCNPGDRSTPFDEPPRVPVRPSSLRGSTMRTATMRLLVMCVGGSLMLGSMCQRLPPVSGCTVGEHRCAGDRPEVCSASLRWEPAGDRPCRDVGGACVVGDAGIAHCAPAQDGGAR